MRNKDLWPLVKLKKSKSFFFVKITNSFHQFRTSEPRAPDSVRQFLAHMRTAPYRNKREWILSFVTGKDVLDLGIIDDYGIEYAVGSEKCLHGHIKKHAASVIDVDILVDEVTELRKLGYEVESADVQTVRLDKKFDVVVCGDLIEHVTNPGALIETIDYHLRDHGVGLVTTPNPFSVGRFFQILAEQWTGVSREHVAWLGLIHARAHLSFRRRRNLLCGG